MSAEISPARQISGMIKQKMQFDRPFGPSKMCPIEDLQAKVDDT